MIYVFQFDPTNNPPIGSRIRCEVRAEVAGNEHSEWRLMKAVVKAEGLLPKCPAWPEWELIDYWDDTDRD